MPCPWTPLANHHLVFTCYHGPFPLPSLPYPSSALAMWLPCNPHINLASFNFRVGRTSIRVFCQLCILFYIFSSLLFLLLLSLARLGPVEGYQASQVALVIKNLPANAGDIRDPGSIPGSGRSPRGEYGNPFQYSCLKNCCFCTVVLENTLESPLDFKEIQPVHPKGDQSWVFIGRTDAKAETP